MRRRLAVLVPVFLVAACGGDADIDDATDALAAVAPPVGAIESPFEPENVYEGGEPIEIDGCCPAFVYRPDDLHSSGWTGTGETLVARYFELPGLVDGDAACAAFADWTAANGATDAPGCDPPAPAAGATSVVGAEPVTVPAGDVVLGAVISVESEGTSAVFTAIVPA